MSAPFLDSVRLMPEKIEDPDAYPFNLPAVQALDNLRFSPVTYFVVENGSGKSTILEAIAVAFGFNVEGGTINFKFATRSSESPLHAALRLVRHARPRGGFFLRAESFFNVATEVERLDVSGYGDRSLHEQSHGESFLALLKYRFGPNDRYILDDPEAALSPARQLALLVRMNELVESNCQLIIGHTPRSCSPIRAPRFTTSTRPA